MPAVLVVFGGLFIVLGLLGLPSHNVMEKIVSGEFLLAGAVFFSCGIIAMTIQKFHTTVALAATAANDSRRT